jgi:hypothetical protein
MTCPYLDYRSEARGKTFETPRAYCRIEQRFVQPMRADLCNDRYDLSHARHCEVYLEHENDGEDDDRDGDER